MQVDWLRISPLTGGTGQTEIYAYVNENTRIGSVRNATVRFTNNEGLTEDLRLLQTSDTSDMRFVVTPDYIYVPGGGGTFYVNVLTNTYWKVSDYDSGLTITSDSPDGYGDGILTIEFPVNPNTNNQYGYDYQGRPFYGREGYITVNSLMGTKTIFWEQAAYNAITVTPSTLKFSQTGETLSATVKSSTDWQITSYDTDNVSFSTLSGTSGETVIYVTKEPLTQNQIDYYITESSEAVFSDGINTSILSINSTLDDYYINDDWITVTYNVPSANTTVILYAYDNTLAIVPDVQFQDDEHTEVGVTAVQIDYQRYISQFFTTFTTSGLHTVKYRFNKDGVIIPRYGFPGNIVGLSGTACYDKIVIGNNCSGVIEACAAINTGFKEVVLGLGNITGIGEFAFYGCGSYDRDFVLKNNVQSTVYQPFHNFKANKFVYDRTHLGGTGSSQSQTITGSGIQNLYIRGIPFKWDGSFSITGVTTYTSDEYIGDIDSMELVIGTNVRYIHRTPFYPYGIPGISKINYNTYDIGFIYASTTYWGTDSSKINGWTVRSISCLSRVSPIVDSYSFTPVTQTFSRSSSNVYYGVFATFNFGPDRNIPLHYPIGADYSAWSSQWSNMIGDLDI